MTLIGFPTYKSYGTYARMSSSAKMPADFFGGEGTGARMEREREKQTRAARADDRYREER